jgi:acetylornithine/N-succinyldiaminopimelate aminotransferase
MDSEKVIKRDNEYVLHTYARNPIVLEKGHGLYAEGPEGQKYLDFTSGIGVNSLGYCDMTWAEAVSGQAHKLQHTSNLYYTAPCGKLAKKLCKRTGMSRVFFGNSGAEANEGAIKAARKYSFDKYGADRYNVITLVNSFHGRTIATLTATGQGVFHNYFGPFNEGFQYVKAGDIDALTEMVDRHTCAVMLELVQGEGGVVALDPEYVQAVRALCDENLRWLQAVLAQTEPTMWAAWGTLIEKRDYLPGLMREMVALTREKNIPWVTFGPRSKKGHPHHPLYLRKDSAPEPFDVENYLNTCFE